MSLAGQHGASTGPASPLYDPAPPLNLLLNFPAWDLTSEFLFKFSSESIARSGMRRWAADSQRTPGPCLGSGSPGDLPRTLRQGEPQGLSEGGRGQVMLRTVNLDSRDLIRVEALLAILTLGVKSVMAGI